MLAVALGPLPLEAQARARIRVGACILEAPEARRGKLETLAAGAREALPLLEQELGVRPRAAYRIVLIPRGAERDAELARLDAFAPAWAGGFLLPAQRVGGIRLALVDRYPYRGALSVLVHEAAHMLMHDGAGGRLPRWFEEGVATWLERRWAARDTLVLTSSLLAHELPPLERLDREFGRSAASARLAYAAAFDFVSWSVERHGAQTIPAILHATPSSGFAEAWRAATGEPLEKSEEAWRQRRLWVSRWLPLLTASSTLWIGITLLALAAAWRRRRRSRELLQKWEDEEAWSESERREWVH